MTQDQKATTITVLQKLELATHRAAGKFLNSSTEWNALKMLAYELHRMETEVRDIPASSAEPQKSEQHAQQNHE